jgi:hypothetical protein
LLKIPEVSIVERNLHFGLSCGGYSAQEQIWLRGGKEYCVSDGNGVIHRVVAAKSAWFVEQE